MNKQSLDYKMTRTTKRTREREGMHVSLLSTCSYAICVMMLGMSCASGVVMCSRLALSRGGCGSAAVFVQPGRESCLALETHGKHKV